MSKIENNVLVDLRNKVGIAGKRPREYRRRKAALRKEWNKNKTYGSKARYHRRRAKKYRLQTKRVRKKLGIK